ncbi:MAG: bifunctional phosphopantothenoylcysteine decarboxylase/phosphopantothenate--cysteine ligase CoaBC [Burkholderiales bacterium]
MTSLSGKRLLLGLTGGIAVYKVADLSRQLVKAGCDVRVVMTDAACRLITPVTMQALSGQPVHTDLWDAGIRDNMGHIELSRDRDLILIAPASADFMAKLSHGRGDDLLSTLCLARKIPLAVAPAMNVEMWENPATRRNLARLREDGVLVLGPAAGEQACGEVGMGRMLEPVDILDAVVALLGPKLLDGKTVLVTAGPTYEPIDTVRGITNQSSGKMGYAVAQAAQEAGAQVTLVSGPTALATPSGAIRVDVTSAREMFDAVMSRAKASDIFISVAAVADYHVVDAKPYKIKRESGKTQGSKRESGNISIELAPNPDILAQVAAMKKAPFCVGFAAETENLRANAQAKRKRKKIPLLAANLAQDTFGRDDNSITLIDDNGEHEIARAAKIVVARQLIAHIAAMLKSR